MRHHHKIASLSITSEEQYRNRWRVVDISCKLKSWMKTLATHRPIYLSFKRTIDQDTSNSRFRISKRMHPFILVGKNRSDSTLAETRYKRSIVTRPCNGTDREQACCVQSETIDLSSRQAIMPWWLSPRSFVMKYCAGACRCE